METVELFCGGDWQEEVKRLNEAAENTGISVEYMTKEKNIILKDGSGEALYITQHVKLAHFLTGASYELKLEDFTNKEVPRRERASQIRYFLKHLEVIKGELYKILYRTIDKEGASDKNFQVAVAAMLYGAFACLYSSYYDMTKADRIKSEINECALEVGLKASFEADSYSLIYNRRVRATFSINFDEEREEKELINEIISLADEEMFKLSRSERNKKYAETYIAYCGELHDSLETINK